MVYYRDHAVNFNFKRHGWKSGMSVVTSQNANAERLTAACVLSVIGGFLDIYTYLCRGKVFANAVTGNMVLFGFHLANLEWGAGAKYLLAIFFYALGVFAAEYVHLKLPAAKRIGWHQSVLILEVICLAPVIFIPYGDFDFAVNSLISFVCALQVQTFRRVHGLPFASTMCTGNLRSGTEAFFRHVTGKDRTELGKCLHYYLVILCFICGAAFGAVLLRRFGHFVFFLVPAGLLAVFFMVTTKRQFAKVRRMFRDIFGKRRKTL